jgi:hypothetical protein
VDWFDIAQASVAIERTSEGYMRTFVHNEALLGMAMGKVTVRARWLDKEPSAEDICRTIARIDKYARALNLDGAAAKKDLKIREMACAGV